MSKYENYGDREDIKDKDFRQLMDTHQNKLKNQDEQIGQLVGVTKQGNKMAVQIGDDLKDQNVKLEKLEEDIELTGNKMTTTKEKFEHFIENGSFWCLYIIIIVEIISLFMVIFFV